MGNSAFHCAPKWLRVFDDERLFVTANNDHRDGDFERDKFDGEQSSVDASGREIVAGFGIRSSGDILYRTGSWLFGLRHLKSSNFRDESGTRGFMKYVLNIGV